ncbi:hypothetical protein [Solicola gregarius]|uniref:Uncharacterized protein n=1 Tax=Solicola gregarius TaxID=2908642 RepID=A0AA46YLH5_9ACTN|nr:hypothetical protein [Solicola gregarius]UYM06642.1 hypothetical protein L0C25_06105 [Solicola gregarius]
MKAPTPESSESPLRSVVRGARRLVLAHRRLVAAACAALAVACALSALRPADPPDPARRRGDP